MTNTPSRDPAGTQHAPLTVVPCIHHLFFLAPLLSSLKNLIVPSTPTIADGVWRTSDMGEKQRAGPLCPHEHTILPWHPGARRM